MVNVSHGTNVDVSEFYPLTLWEPGMELKLWGLAASPFMWWAISQAQKETFLNVFKEKEKRKEESKRQHSQRVGRLWRNLSTRHCTKATARSPSSKCTSWAGKVAQPVRGLLPNLVKWVQFPQPVWWKERTDAHKLLSVNYWHTMPHSHTNTHVYIRTHTYTTDK